MAAEHLPQLFPTINSSRTDLCLYRQCYFALFVALKDLSVFKCHKTLTRSLTHIRARARTLIHTPTHPLIHTLTRSFAQSLSQSLDQ